MAQVLKLYHLTATIEIRSAVSKAINASVIQLVVLVLLLLSLREFYSRLFFLFFYSVFVPSLIVSRWLFVRWLRGYYKKAKNRKPVLLLGNSLEAQQFNHLINENPQYGFTIKAWFQGGESDGDLNEAKALFRNKEVTEVFCGF